MGLQMVRAPTTLEYVTSHHVGVKCTAITFCRLFAVAHESGLRAFNTDFKPYLGQGRSRTPQKSSDIGCFAESVTSVDYFDYNSVWYVGPEAQSGDRVICNQRLQNRACNFVRRFSSKRNDTASCLAANKSFVVVSYPSNKTIIILSLLDHTYKHITLKYFPYSCRFIPDSTNEFIVSNELGIAYYKISAKEGEETACILQWFCDQAPDTHGLAFLKDGKIGRAHV